MSKQRWRLICGISFICFSLATTYVNKYVLSILKFTYPTIYLSWQTGSMAVMILTSHVLGYIQLSSSIDFRSVILPSLPSMLAFVGMIYAGSKALSHLPIPVFCVIHSLSQWVSTLYDWISQRKDPTNSTIFYLTAVTGSFVILSQSDPQLDFDGYRWMLAHCVCQGLYSSLSKDKRLNKLKELDRAFCNAIFSVILLISCSVVSGELYVALEFPFLFYGKFHLGCLCSGVFGTMWILSTKWLNDSISSSDEMNVAVAVSKVLLVVGSFLFFDTLLTVPMCLSILFSLASSILYTYRNAVTQDGTTSSHTDASVL